MTPSEAHAVSRTALRDALLSPRSVALVGASDDVTKTASRPLRFLRQSGFKGIVYPVNPRRDTVLGERAWPSLAALPEAPDHAFILTPTEVVIPAVEECGRLGIPVVTILASGFAEGGGEGAVRDRQLRQIIERTGVRVVGPSSLGVVNLRERLVLTANAAFAEPDLPVGHTFVASHSGSMIGALVSRGLARGLGFAGLVSVGNEIDLSIGEICAATLDDPAIDGYLLFLETIRKADWLRAFALAAAERGKPIIAYKLGRSRAAAELAVSHTGALAGEDDVADAFLKDCGIARVETFEAVLEGLPLLSRMPAISAHVRRPRVAVVTTTGGGAAMIVDQLGIRDIAVEAPSAETLGRLADAGVEVSPERIVDLTLAGTRYQVMKSALDVLLTAPEFDLIVAVPGSSARFEPGLAVQPLIDCAGASKPLAAFVVPDAPEALARLTAAGIPNFRTPEACADAIAAAFARRRPRPPPVLSAPRVAGPGRLLDELEAYAVLDRLGVPHAPAVALDATSKTLPSLSIPYPVAVKVLSDKVVHKTDADGVVLGVQNERELTGAIAQIRENVEKQLRGTTVERVLVQQMADGIGEVLAGYRIDAAVGPIVMLAAGGVLTEIYRDRSLRLAPVDLDTAHEMIQEVKALRALTGYRGKPAGDLHALASAIVALSQLAVIDDPIVAEAEVNPLLVLQEGMGVVAVDALVRLG
jgi:acyl-CoA synthetase (NDP forming)